MSLQNVKKKQYHLIIEDQNNTKRTLVNWRCIDSQSLFKVIVVCVLLIIIVQYNTWTWSINDQLTYVLTTDEISASPPPPPPAPAPPPKGYFVYSSKCHMPSLDPFAKDVLEIFKKMPYRKCAQAPDLITVIYNKSDQSYRLRVNKENVRCCYREVIHKMGDRISELQYRELPCSNFLSGFVVPRHVEAAITECRWTNRTKIIQKDGFSFVHPKKSNVTGTNRRPSVLLWAIDSMSRMNFERTMPLTHQYFHEHDWFEMQGYNKIGDNTFPNVMALLTGYNLTKANSECQPETLGGLNNCPLMWNKYKEHGYLTAYGEDWVRISTFNYYKKGFVQQPTDFYLRPLALAIERKIYKMITNTPNCVGRHHYAEYIYDFGEQFAKVHTDQATFGLVWTNSFSHNSFSLPSTMDARMVEYMRTLDKNHVMDNTIIVFFSDHGMRFGPLRKLKSGFVEERLPMLYIRLPKWVREKYPQFVKALQLNRNRLSSPYDLYATLMHILELETPLEQLPRPDACPTCHSIFYELPQARDCSEAGIEEKWCTCNVYNEMPTTDHPIPEITTQLLDATNEYLRAKNLSGICSTLTLSNIVEANVQEQLKPSDVMFYRVKYNVDPKQAVFDATVQWNSKTKQIVVNVEDISRLNVYENVTKCIDDKQAKKVCICK